MSQRQERVLVFGDSIAKGVVYQAERGRYATLKTTAVTVAADELSVSVENRARFGFTAPRGMDLVYRDLDGGLTCDAAVLEFGGNDCNFDWAAISENPDAVHTPATPPEKFYSSMCGMAKRLLDAKIKPIFITLPPIDAERYFRFLVGESLSAKNILKWLGDIQQIYRFQELYSGLVQKAATAMHCMLIDVRMCLLKEHQLSELICEDGLHWNQDGQILLGNTIAGLIRREGRL